MTTALNFRYQLDGKSGSPRKKFTCPDCRHKGRFRKYYDYEKKEYLDDACGLCDRGTCGYHLTPKDYFNTNPDKKEKQPAEERLIKIINRPLIHLQPSLLESTLNNYESNSFIKPLTKYFPIDQIESVVSDYYLGTYKAGFKEEGINKLSCLFWFIDKEENIRAGQIKLFNEDLHTAKYVTDEGEKRNFQTWVHSSLIKKFKAENKPVPSWLTDYSEGDKVTCLYGEHLLSRYPHLPVVLVEAPKSAIIGRLMFPQYLWLATTSLSYLTKERCKVLKGRNVLLLPDTGKPNPRTGRKPIDEWKLRVDEFNHLAQFSFFTLFENIATEEEVSEGFDIADYLLKDLEARKIEIFSTEVVYKGQTITGSDFDRVAIVSLWDHTGNMYRVLYDQDGGFTTDTQRADRIIAFFGLPFQLGRADGEPCFIHLEN